MEYRTKEGESPVDEIEQRLSGYLSTTGHEQPGGNLGRPFSKPKYKLATDSEQVPRGKGEKHPG